MERIISKQAPNAIGPYVHATVNDQLVFTSGQIGLDSNTNKLVDGIENQTKLALNNLQNVLLDSKSGMDNILKITIYLSDMNNFSKVNEIYANYFKNGYPARTAIEVSQLPMNALIEIEAVAIKN